jgi:uncharacterized protein YhbP (UPF0306 family)
VVKYFAKMTQYIVYEVVNISNRFTDRALGVLKGVKFFINAFLMPTSQK